MDKTIERDSDLADKIEQLEAQVVRLKEERSSVADANVMAAELMVQLEEAGDDLQRANDDLIEQHSQKLALHSAIRSALIALDKNRLITEWNEPAEQLFGLSAKQMLGQKFSGSEIDWCDESVQRALENCCRSGKSVKLNDIVFTRPNDGVGNLQLVFTRVDDGNGASVGVLILGDDVTDEKTQEAQHAQSQKLESIGQLSAGIAHEINTPIQFIGDNLSFLNTSFKDLKSVIDCIEIELASGQIGDECKGRIRNELVKADWKFLVDEVPLAISQAIDGTGRVSTIVRAMKEFAFPSQGAKVIVDLNKQIETTAIVASSEWKYIAELETQFDPGVRAVPCFPDEINQVILIMIVNAAHAIADVTEDGKKGCIRIVTGQEGSNATIRISDNGAGIPQKNLDRIFDQFFTTKTVGKGTGQGLSIAHNVITNNHGGKIQIESEMGTGSTFTIHLPLEDAGKETSYQQSSISAAQKAGVNLRTKKSGAFSGDSFPVKPSL